MAPGETCTAPVWFYGEPEEEDVFRAPAVSDARALCNIWLEAEGEFSLLHEVKSIAVIKDKMTSGMKCFFINALLNIF